MYRNFTTNTGWASTKPKLLRTDDTIFCDIKYQPCYFKKILKYIIFFFCYQFQTVSNTLYHFVFVFTHWNDMKLSISQWNWWKIEIMFMESYMKPSISQWSQWKIEIMFWDTDMKPSISLWNWWKIEIMPEIDYFGIMLICLYEMVTIRKISIYDHLHLNFHKKGSQYQI